MTHTPEQSLVQQPGSAAWLNSLTSQGYALREEGLIIDIDSNYGGGGSDYWVEIGVVMEVYVSAP